MVRRDCNDPITQPIEELPQIVSNRALPIDPRGMFDSLPPLVPPPRFAVVERGVYRSAYPTLRSFPFVRTLDLKCIISLTPEEPTLDLKEFCRSHRITLKAINVEKFKGGNVTLLPTDVSQALEMLLNASMHPLLIHCLDGRHVTGTVVMLLRRILMWHPSSAFAEHSRFTGVDEANSQEEIAFVNEFVTPIQLSRAVPSWLWGGRLVDREGRPVKHPQMRLRHPTSAPTAQAPSAPSANPAMRIAGPSDAALVVKAKGDGATNEVELSAELRMLGFFDSVSRSAASMGVVASAASSSATDRRRTDQSNRRSRSAEALRR